MASESAQDEHLAPLFLAETFSTERANFEGQLDQTDTGHMRVALRRYRSFFQRLLSL